MVVGAGRDPFKTRCVGLLLSVFFVAVCVVLFFQKSPSEFRFFSFFAVKKVRKGRAFGRYVNIFFSISSLFYGRYVEPNY